MAVIEELVAKLGFDVEGLAKLKVAAKEFDKAKKNIVASTNPLKAAGASASVAAVGVGKLGAQSKKSSRSVLLLGTAMRGIRRAGSIAASALRAILLVALKLVGAFAGLVAGAAAVAAGFVLVGVKAALARREVRLAAAEIGTSAQSLETVGNIIKGIGFGDGFADEAKKVVGAIDEVAKTIKKGGDEADEAKKKFKGFGIDQSFDVDPKTGKTRDSAAIALDVFQAYKRATEQAANLRKQADALGSKAPKRAAELRKKAIEQDRKSDQLAEDSGISGKLKVLLDGLTGKQFETVANEISRLFPTTSNKEEARRADVASQAVEAGLKFDALLQGLSERFKEIGTALAVEFLPGLNSFLDGVISFAKRTGIIKETVGERDARIEMQREGNRGSGLGRASAEDLQAEAARSQKRFEDSIKARSERIKKQVSPEANAAKMQGAAEAKADNRKYENIGNDQRTISPSVTVNATGLEAVATAVKNSILGAISTKGANTSTGALTTP
jgi:hypothetical protein